jgi:hypothetical protein
VIAVAPLPGPITREAARRAARSELSKHIYHRYDDSWLTALVKYVGRWLARSFDAISRHAPGGGLGTLALLAIVVALVLVARWRLGPLGRQPRHLAVVLDGRPKTATERRQSAEAAAAEHDWRTAIVEGMRAIARELEERAILEPRAGRTADELARDGGQSLPDAAAALHRAAATFDAVVYGRRPGTPAAYDEIRAADTMVLSAAVVRRTSHMTPA